MSNKETQNIGILYEDNDILALNKPAGMLTHEDGRSKGPFLTDWIKAQYPDAANVGESMVTPEGGVIERPGIVHRLDAGTSGVILVAKTKQGYENLKDQFKNKEVKKKYLAIAYGEMEDEFGTIDRPIGRSKNDFRKWSSTRGARGEMREAETYWTKLGVKEFEASEAYGNEVPVNSPQKIKLTLMEVEPKTGRTHQIRVHLSAINHPIIGDVVYAPAYAKVFGLVRPALHASSVAFKNLKGERITVSAPTASDLEEIIKKFKKR